MDAYSKFALQLKNTEIGEPTAFTENTKQVSSWFWKTLLILQSHSRKHNPGTGLRRSGQILPFWTPNKNVQWSQAYGKLLLPTAISLQSPGSFHWRMVFRNQDLLTRCAHCYWTIVVPRCSQKNILENICVHIHIPSHMYLSMYACMYVCNLPI